MKTRKANVDEIMSRRKDVSGGGTVLKAARAPSTWNKQSRSVRFVMNAQAPDRMGDIVVTAGIDTSEFEKNPVGLLFHSSRSWPIGSWSELEKKTSGRPPRLEGTLTLLPANGPIKEIDETAWMIENGGVRACSIGFRPDWDEAEMILDAEGKWTGGIQWNVCELLEGSVVPLPASPQSLAKDAGGDFRLARDLIEEVLDTYAKTPEGLLIPMGEYEKAYKTVVEKTADDASTPAAQPAETELKGDEPADPVKDDDEPECEPMEGEGEEAKAAELAEFKAFLAKNLNDGDDLHLYYKLEGRMPVEKGITVQHPGTDKIDKFEFKGSMSAEHREAIAARVAEIADMKAAHPENKPETQTPIVVSLSADTTEVEAAVTKVEGLFARLAKQFPLFFPKAVEERIEPTIVPPEPTVPPTAEAINAAAAKAAAVRERLASKGLIAA